MSRRAMFADMSSLSSSYISAPFYYSSYYSSVRAGRLDTTIRPWASWRTSTGVVAQDVGGDLEDVALDVRDRGEVLRGQPAEDVLHQVVGILTRAHPALEETQQRRAVLRGHLLKPWVPGGS